MHNFRIGLLAFVVHALAGCNQPDKVATEQTKVPHGSHEESSCDCNLEIAAELENTRAEFKKSYPTPDNIEEIKSIWTEAETSYLNSAEKGVTAHVEIIDKSENVVYGVDYFVISNGVKQLREDRGKSQAVTFDERVCLNHQNVSESIQDAMKGNSVIEFFPNKDNEFNWACESYPDSVYYGLKQIDFDYVIEGSVKAIELDGKPGREIRLVLAKDFSVNPFEQNSRVKLQVGESDSLPRTLRVTDTLGADVVEVAQWVYDYESPVSFITLPKEQIKPEQQD